MNQPYITSHKLITLQKRQKAGHFVISTNSSPVQLAQRWQVAFAATKATKKRLSTAPQLIHQPTPIKLHLLGTNIWVAKRTQGCWDELGITHDTSLTNALGCRAAPSRRWQVDEDRCGTVAICSLYSLAVVVGGCKNWWVVGDTGGQNVELGYLDQRSWRKTRHNKLGKTDQTSGWCDDRSIISRSKNTSGALVFLGAGTTAIEIQRSCCVIAGALDDLQRVTVTCGDGAHKANLQLNFCQPMN